MADFGEGTANEDLRGAIDRALNAGLELDEIARVVAERAALFDKPQEDLSTDALQQFDQLPVYERGALPDGLIDLPTASRKYGVNGSTMRRWVISGKIPSRGRLKAPARGGGYLVLSEAELVDYINAPRNKGGRPRGK